jgi:GT2 family glycosyltransferase
MWTTFGYQEFVSTKFNNLGLVYCKYDVIDLTGKKDMHAEIVPLNKKISGMAFTELLEGNKILSSGSGVLIKRNIFEDVGYFDETLEFGEDWDMWLRIAEKYEVGYINDILVHIRRHGQNMTNDLSKVFIGELNFYNKWVPKIENKYSLPKMWPYKVVMRIITRFPKKDFLKIARETMKKDVYVKFFRQRQISFFIYFSALKN